MDNNYILDSHRYSGIAHSSTGPACCESYTTHKKRGSGVVHSSIGPACYESYTTHEKRGSGIFHSSTGPACCESYTTHEKRGSGVKLLLIVKHKPLDFYWTNSPSCVTVYRLMYQQVLERMSEWGHCRTCGRQVATSLMSWTCSLLSLCIVPG